MNEYLPIIAVVVAVAFVAFLFLRRRKPDASAPAELPQTRPAEPDHAPAPAAAEVAAPVEAPAEPEAASAEAATDAEPEAAAPAEVPAAEAEPEPAPEPTPEPEPARREATAEEVAALRDGLGSTRGGFISKLASLFKRKQEVSTDVLEEMEELLITADIGVRTTDKILERLRGAMESGAIKGGDSAWAALREHSYEILAAPGGGGLNLKGAPTVILVIGVNGVGKTTTIGKLASRMKAEGKKVLLAAGDTFRAAAVLQLEVWGRRVGCEVVKGKDRADPGSVIFDAVKKGMEMGADVVIADTAGRLHTKTPLMDELQKVGRTAEKALGRPADEVLLVLDSTTGQNAIQQAELFK
ncbi:MAG: signaling recognition particle receptor family protein, partial [Myxococcota bacterium]